MRHPINGTSHQLGGWLAVFPSFLDPYEFPALPSLSSSTLSLCRPFIIPTTFRWKFFVSFDNYIKPLIAKPKNISTCDVTGLSPSLQGIYLFFFFLFLFFSFFSFPFLKFWSSLLGWQFMQELSQWRSATSTALVQSSRVHVQRHGARQSLPGSSFEVATWGGGVEKKKA